MTLATNKQTEVPIEARNHSPLARSPFAWSPLANRIAWALLALGALLRIAWFAHRRCLWLDELYLASSILTRGYRHLLFDTLDYQQLAPPGFLLLTRLSVQLFGPGERALRLTSLLFSLASLPLFLGVVRRCLSSRSGIMAVALFALLTPLIYYAGELKQYTCDVTVTLGILLAAFRTHELAGPRRLKILAIVGAVGIFFSQPAVFVLAGAGGTLMVFHRRDWRLRWRLIVIAVIWLLMFDLEYFLFLRSVLSSESYPNLVRYWEPYHAFMPPWPRYMLPWMWHALRNICHDYGTMWLDYADIGVAATLVGFAALWAARRRALAMILSPLPFVLIASMLRKYPFGDRVVLFVVPSLLILMAAGIDLIWGHASRLRAFAGFVMLAMILLPTVQRDYDNYRHGTGREETLPAYQWIAQHWLPGDTLYLYHVADVSFYHYKDQAGFPADPATSGQVLIQPNCADHFSGYLDDLQRGRKRVWVVFTHVWIDRGLDEEKYTLSGLDQLGTRQPAMDFHDFGVSASLYDLSDKTSTMSLPENIQ